MLQVFARRGVRMAFGIPGGLISAVFDALADVPEIELVMTRHEAMAAFCAIGHAVATGTPALVLTTSGPGITNALTGVAAALLEELPLIFIGGDVPASAMSRGAIQDASSNGVDSVALMRTVTRWSTRIDSAAGAQGAAEQAMRIATGSRPGPVFLSLPIDVSNARGRVTHLSIADSVPPPAPDSGVCREAMQRLRRANARSSWWGTAPATRPRRSASSPRPRAARSSPRPTPKASSPTGTRCTSEGSASADTRRCGRT